MTVSALDPIALTQDLIRCPSVTPADEGALDLLQRVLEGLGFVCTRLPFEEDGTDPVDNLYARLGTASPNLCFAGHTDVVPVGSADQWTVDPFAADIKDGMLVGRGASDMKGAIAAWVAAVSHRLSQVGPVPGSISLLITGDEEGPSINGTKKMLPALAARGEVIDHCITGEPTNPTDLGTMMKIGRRGSLNGYITVEGVQGHTGYPHLADNAAHRLAMMMAALVTWKIDDGSDHFEPSVLSITQALVDNAATNVIPAKASARFNIRFNDLHSGASLTKDLQDLLTQAAGDGAKFKLDVIISGESFLTPPGLLSDILTEACETVTGNKPDLSTTGGTSDSRFIKDYCPVVDFGLVGQTMHQVDERVAVSDITALSKIYARVIDRYFAQGAA
ncbi:MAG: succinyl-diaminopimelate desuccinylase [Rhodospirillaceae bacterium]|nr:succinyl-diaminopimelate desuccinylase [Rhodospirillaceae bacterium]MAX64178.1 succinyl-diaminopimelate desuccinylase [Rhodospirillaceae bacterium]MBB57438.1 succinyl-diaminopimelate desuccinylase [Rhodospirillaceae bacterium]|tara:strand:- start:11001 stop:12173 length:1173 start_codon:yes stop_codon:yes gene_type:complete